MTFLRDLLSLEDISGGRILCGIGTGGDIDSRILGGEPLTPRERVDRLAEFTELLDRLLTDRPRRPARATYFSAVDARTLPGPVQRPRTPFIMAANGPRSLRLAAQYGAGWVTTGPKVDTLEEWWTALKGLGARLDDALAAQGRDGDAFERHLNLDSSPVFSLSSADAFEEMTGRAADLGFTDVITHWPRPQDPYAGSVTTLEQVAAQVLPRWR